MDRTGTRSRGGDPAASILTFLIADIRGYTSYTQRHGDEAAAELAAAFAEIARECVEARDGEVVELRGDEVLAVFQSARQALRAAVDLQLVLADEVELHPDRPLRVGIGLDAGEAIPVEDGYRGGALNLAARLCSQAAAGEVLASQGVLQMARAVEGLTFHERGEVEMKGLAEPIRVSQVAPEGLDPAALAARFVQAVKGDGSGPTRSEVPAPLETVTPMVGREREIRRLRWAWRRARRGAGSTWFVVGPTGIGKTRLLAELAEAVADDGAAISYVSLRPTAVPAAVQNGDLGRASTLVIVDDLEADETRAMAHLSRPDAGGDGSRTLVVAAVDDTAASPELVSLAHRGGEDVVIRPPPLDAEQIRAVAALYLGRAVETLPASVLDDTGGVPQRIHERVSEWAHTEARRRLGEVASRAAVGRSDLRSVESELAGSVVDLQLVRERARLFEAGPGRAATPAEAPFMGLASFDVGDADLFFGRERLVAELVARLPGTTLLGVVGPSGSGKSSAVRAGLIPAVRVGALPGSESWLVALMRPGEHPLRELDRAVWASFSDGIRSRLQGTDLPLRSVREVLDVGECLFVVVDQFEEVYTACSDPAERAAFIAALIEAANDPRRRVVVVIAVRADFYGRCAEDPAFAELLGDNHVLVGPMTADEYRRAIEQPAQRVGVRIDPALTDALVAEVVEEPGGLPLLSTALLELWDLRDGRSLRLDAYIQTGGVRGAVARLAEEAYGSFDEEERAVVRSVMLRLTGTGEGDAAVRRRVPLHEFDTERNETVARVIRGLTDRRLLTVSEGSVEVAHEALLREWPRLQEWLDEDRAGRRLRAHLTDAAREWADAGREPGELYRGARLATALDWTTEHTLELNELERDFLNTSRLASQADAERQRRTNRRLRVLLAGAGTFLAVAVVAGVLAVIQRSEAEAAAVEATAQRLGAQAVVEDELDLSLLLARQGYEIHASIDTESTLLASVLNAPGAIAVLPGTGNRVLLIRGSDDGEVLATTDNTGGVAIYSAAELRLERTVQFDDQYWFDIGPDGTTLAGATYEDGPVVALVDTESGTIARTPLPDGADFAASVAVAFHPSGAWFASLECRDCDNDPTPILVRRDPTDGAELRLDQLPDISFAIDRISYSDDGEMLLVGGSDEESDVLEILDADTLESRQQIRGGFHAEDLSLDGRTLAIGRFDGSVALIDVATGEEEAMDGRHNAAVQGVAFSPDGETLLTTGDDRVVIVWDLDTHSIREILNGHAGRITWQPAFDADGSTAFTVGLDGKVIAWDLVGERRIGRGQPVADGRQLAHDAFMAMVTAATADGAAIATTTEDGGILVADGETGQLTWDADPWTDERLEELAEEHPDFAPTFSGSVVHMAFSQDGRLLAVSGENPEVVLYDVETGDEVRRWQASGSGWVNGVSFTADGALVTAGDDGRVVVWDLESGEPTREYEIFPEPVTMDDYLGAPFKAVLDPEGSRLAVLVQNVGAPMDVTILDARTGDRLWTEQADEFVANVAWSPDGQTLAISGWQVGNLTLRDGETGEQRLEPVTASAGFVLTTEFTPDGDLVVTAGTDGTVRLWDAATLKQIGTTLPQSEHGWTTAHTTTAGTIVSISDVGRFWRWDLDPARWAEQACTVANRTLTESEWRLFLGSAPYEPTCGAAS